MRWNRAQALESIAFDNSAELELRAAYAETHATQLLLAIAEAAVKAGHYPAASSRRARLSRSSKRGASRKFPDDAWRTAYPLPYRDWVEREAAAQSSRSHAGRRPGSAGVGLRQRRRFAFRRRGADAVAAPHRRATSARSCACGFSARKAVRSGVQFASSDSLYLSGLLEAYGTPEAALAAYNAGENRVAQWQAGQNYEETAEFVESIPFNETRDYVQIVSRNAELYRNIYGRTAQRRRIAAVAPIAAARQARCIRRYC